MTPKRTTWTVGAAILSVLALAWSPALAGPRKGGDDKQQRKVAEARQKAMEKAARQRRKTIEEAAKQQRQTARIEGRQERKNIEAEKKAAVAVAKARQKAAEAAAKAARARTPVRKPVVVVKPPLPRFGPRVVLGGRDAKHRIEFGLNARTDRRWVPGRYVTRTERVLVEPAHYEVRTRRVLVEAGHFEVRVSGPTEEILYDSRGRAHKVIVSPGGREKVWVPDRYEVRRTKVWAPDRYETRQVRVWKEGHWTRPPAHVGILGGLRAIFRF